jgi:hypothetical protein
MKRVEQIDRLPENLFAIAKMISSHDSQVKWIIPLTRQQAGYPCQFTAIGLVAMRPRSALIINGASMCRKAGRQPLPSSVIQMHLRRTKPSNNV